MIIRELKHRDAAPVTSQDDGSPGPNPAIPYQELPCLIALDTEVSPHSRKVRAIGAYRPAIDDKTLTTGTQHGQDSALAQLYAATKGASFVLGHNIISHDLPHIFAGRLAGDRNVEQQQMTRPMFVAINVLHSSKGKQDQLLDVALP